MLLTSLMWELECLLHEYLCFNWDRIDDVLQSNEEALRWGCFWQTLLGEGPQFTGLNRKCASKCTVVATPGPSRSQSEVVQAS